jgi:FAD/FMN-containing dehydrogenase
MLPPELTPIAVRPGDAGYAVVRDTYLRHGSPAVVLRVRDADEIAAALRYARGQATPLSLRSGGHGISGRSTNAGGTVIDLARIDGIRVLDADTGLVRVGAGALWGDVAAALAPHALAITCGDTGDVGVGGLATAGGIGWLARRDGLTIDEIETVELVTADGCFHRVDATHEPDLFWAMRGAGANFGVATAFELRARRCEEIVVTMTLWDGAELNGLLARWAAAAEAAPRELSGALTVTAYGPGLPVSAHAISVYAGGDARRAAAALGPPDEIAPVLSHEVRRTRYSELLQPTGTRHRAQQPLAASRSGLLTRMTGPVADAVAAVVASAATPTVQLRTLGGAVNDTPADATAYAHRSQALALTATALPEQAALLDLAWDALHPWLDGLHASFETGVGERRLRDAFPPATLARLRALKAIWDPESLLRDNFPITPADD